jgi:hypothetical protein
MKVATYTVPLAAGKIAVTGHETAPLVTEENFVQIQ